MISTNGVKENLFSHLLMSRRMTSFQKYFELGGEESESPFLNRYSKNLSRNIHLKSAALAAIFLFVAFVVSFFSTTTPLMLLSFVYLLVGTPALIASLEDIFVQKDINIDVLMTLSAFLALSMGHIYEGALLLVLFALSASLEDAVTLRAKSALVSIHEIAPSKAYVMKDDGSFSEKSVHDINVGSRILIRSGEIVPLDGVVIHGDGSLSMAHLTGESRELPIKIGDTVISGSRLVQGSLTVQISTTQADSTVMQIIRLITEAESSKPKFSLLFEKFGRIYSISVILTTVLIVLIFPIVFSIPLVGTHSALLRGISFLITASPCALFIAVPIAYLSALSASVKKGAILKGGTVFDQLNGCSTVAFDKTGTLTEGSFRFREKIDLFVEGHELVELQSSTLLLSLTASVEQHVVHPMAQAIVEYAKKESCTMFEVSSVNVFAGVGVKGEVFVPIEGGKNKKFLVDIRSPSREDKEKIAQIYQSRDQKLFDLSQVVVVISDVNEPKNRMGFVLVFEDMIREESAVTILRLRELGKKIVMLSGDHNEIAKSVAAKVGITNWFGELTPQNKLEIITNLSKNPQEGLVMVGDGLNDAPSLARANVGISMGRLSSASARDAADIVLLEDNLLLIPWLFTKARQTRHIVFQNLFIAFLAISVGTIASLFGLIPLWVAVIVHEGSTLIVGLNALRLIKNSDIS